MNNYEEQYINLLSDICELGTLSKNRTGINTKKVWGAQIYVNLQRGFPLLTTKKMHWKSVVHELLWMINGDTNIQYLLKNGVTFWTEWPYQKYLNACGTEECNDQKSFEQKIINDDEFAKKWGSIGEYGYGGMWRHFPFYTQEDKFKSSTGVIGCSAEHWTFGEVDQLVKVINELKTNPDSRRIIITAWHPYHSNNREDALLPACHNYIQFGTEELTLEERDVIPSDYLKVSRSHEELDQLNIPRYRLNCYFNMRSNDVPLGLPYNIAFYALFTHLVAHCVNMIPSQLVYSGADVHIYENQLGGIKEQLSRTPGELPQLVIRPECPKNLFDIKFEHIDIVNYNPQSHIKMPVAV
jgi:thymidylate synthase